MEFKGAPEIQWKENYNTSLEKRGSNRKQRTRVVQEDKIKENYGPDGKIKSIQKSRKISTETTTWNKVSKAGVSLNSMMYPAIAD
ncbi:hypothetical protein MDA_GLEAN10013415 [Myotis davidii]|uniref:Uncharacterized protein n=1 Tax=Myotis davidii TaxID=225400 RepID=L5LWS5_MYODS|nr:hypothetical protein MDA_GLEAN10013415 [Myotis davidii]